MDKRIFLEKAIWQTQTRLLEQLSSNVLRNPTNHLQHKERISTPGREIMTSGLSSMLDVIDLIDNGQYSRVVVGTVGWDKMTSLTIFGGLIHMALDDDQGVDCSGWVIQLASMQGQIASVCLAGNGLYVAVPQGKKLLFLKHECIFGHFGNVFFFC
ncbi:unnamed protein product [Absidia cylindrospora]